MFRIESASNPKQNQFSEQQFSSGLSPASEEVILEVILVISITFRQAGMGAPSLTFGRAAMRRWGRLLDSYIEEHRKRGVSTQSVAYTEARLNRWGRWLKAGRLVQVPETRSPARIPRSSTTEPRQRRSILRSHNASRSTPRDTGKGIRGWFYVRPKIIWLGVKALACAPAIAPKPRYQSS